MAGEVEQRKLFVGGLSPGTTEESLRAYFSSYGRIEYCNLKFDQLTSRSKCFGFITFAEDKGVVDVLAEGSHNIDGKNIDPKRATKQKRDEPPRPKKVFVGGVPNDISEQELQQHFSKYGEVLEVVFPVVPETQKRRGFAFVEFVSEDSVEEACSNSKQAIGGDQMKKIDVKPATPRGDNQRGRGGGRGGGRGRGGGGYGQGGYGGGGGYGQGGYGGGGYDNGGGGGGYGGGGYGGGGYGGGSGGYGSGGGGYGGGSYDGSGGYGGGGGGYGGGGYGGGGDYGGGYGKAPRRGGRGGGGYHPYGQ